MAEDKPILTDEERERLLAEDALRRNRRTRYYGKLTQTSSQYEKANIVRGSTFGQIVSERMLRGQGGVSAFKGAIGEKIGAVGMGIREKFDPIRLLNKVPILGGALATMYGMKRGRSAADISYFTGAGRFLRQQPTPGELGDVPGQGGTGLASKLKPETSSSNAKQKNINGTKTTLGALKKIYALEKTWYDEEKKYRDDEKKEKQIANSFREEQEMERHRELIKSLTGKNSKLDTKKPTAKKEEQQKESFGDFVEKMVGYDIGKNILKKIGPWLLEFIAMPAFLGVAAGVITALAITTLAKIAGNMYEYMTGKSVKSLSAYDPKTTPKKMQEDIIWSEVNYNEGAYKRDMKELTKKDIKPGRKKDLEERTSRYERVQEFKKTDSFQQWKKQEQSKPSVVGGKPNQTASKVGGKEGQALEFFESRRWTPEQASGIVANLKRENSTFDPKLEGDNGQSIGIAQWQPPRQKVFKEVMGTDIRDSSFEQQLEFIDWELNNGEYKRAGDKLRQAKTASEAGKIFSMDYERPADKLGEAMRRGDLAEKIHLSRMKPINQPDALSNRMNVAVSENKNLTSNQQQVAPPIMVNTTNNVIGKGGQSTAMAGPTPVRNDEPMLLRSQYGMVKPV